MGTQPRAGDLRGLKALVGVLGMLVVLGTALVIGVVIHRLYAKPQAASMIAAPESAPMVPGAPELTTRLPAGATIKAIAAAGPDLAIWISAPGGDQILLIDPATGKASIAVSTAR